MINKIIFSLFAFCMFIAIPLALAGIEHVELGDDFLMFMNRCSLELQRFKIEIPSIPMINTDSIGDTEWYKVVVSSLANFVNFLSTLINILGSLLNVLIQLFQFIFIVIKNLTDMVHNITGDTSESIWTSAEEGSSGSYGSMSAVEGFLRLNF